MAYNISNSAEPVVPAQAIEAGGSAIGEWSSLAYIHAACGWAVAVKGGAPGDVAIHA